MKGKVFFGIVVLASCGVIYGVHYQREQERLYMRRYVIQELKEYRELQKANRKD